LGEKNLHQKISSSQKQSPFFLDFMIPRCFFIGYKLYELFFSERNIDTLNFDFTSDLIERDN